MRDGIPIVGLVTLPSGAGKGVSDYEDLHGLSLENELTVIDTEDINSPDTLDQIRRLQPDYVFTLGWNRLFKEELLSLPTGFVIGSHPTRLPEGRGRAPIPWTILLGKSSSAITLFRMDPGPDSGDILVQKEFQLLARPYAFDVYRQAAEAMRDGFIEIYEALARGEEITQRRQDDQDLSVYLKRTPADGLIDFHQSAMEVDRLIRAVSRPYPGAYSFYEGQKVTCWQVDLAEEPPVHGAPGQIVRRDGERLLVVTGDAPLWLSNLSIAGEAVPAAHFRVGNRFAYRLQDEVHALRMELRRVRDLLGD